MVSGFTSDRVPEDGFEELTEFLTDDNGKISVRGHFIPQDNIPDLKGELLGQLLNYSYNDRTDGLCGIFQDEEDVAHFYYLDSVDVKDWVRCELPFTSGARGSLTQIDNKIAIVNGVDKLVYFDLSSREIITFTPISDPVAAPTVTAQGFSGDNKLRFYYCYTWNSKTGETGISPAAYIDLPLRRAEWGEATVSVSLPELPENATSFNIYCGLSGSDSAAAPASVEEWLLLGRAQTGGSFLDDSSLTPQPISPPSNNTTDGIIARFINNINGILWAIGSGVESKRIYWGGVNENAIDFSLSYGGGNRLISNNGIYTPVAIFRSLTEGNVVCNAVLCSGLNGGGRRYNLTPVQITQDGKTRQEYTIEEVRGNDGTSAPLGVVDYLNSLYYPTIDGFKSTGLKANISSNNVTDLISRAISDKTKHINFGSLDNCVATVFHDRIFWSVAYSSSQNNQIWVYDVLRKGIWSIWNVPTDYIFVYTPNTKASVSGLYIVQGLKIYVYNESGVGGEMNATFHPVAKSGLLYLPPSDGRQWVRLLQTVFTLENPQGSIDFRVEVKTRRGVKVYTGAFDYPDIRNIANVKGVVWSGAATWSSRRDFSAQNAGSTDYVDFGLQDVQIKINKDIQWVRFTISSNDRDVALALVSVALEYVDVGVGLDFNSRDNLRKL
jgi:hypothetical protein